MNIEIMNIVPLQPTAEFFARLEPVDQALVIAYRAIGSLAERPLTEKTASLILELEEFTGQRQFNPPAEKKPKLISN